MKKPLRYLCLLISLCLIQPACSPGDFGDTNVDPNALETPIPSALLTYNQIQTGYNMMDLVSGLYCQYFSETQFNDISQYAVYNRDWSAYYAGILYDTRLIIDLNSDPNKAPDQLPYGSNANQIAVARILMAYNFSKLTDMYGDIPYSEALKLQAYFPYDRQEDIYKGLLSELKEAINQFDDGAGPTGDILYNGNVTKWKKFANALRLVLAMRMSDAAPELAKAEFLEALNDPAGLIEFNADNAVLTYSGLYRNPWYNLYNGFKSYAISLPLVDTLTALNDPRLPVFGQPNNAGKVTGFPYGITRDSAISFTSAHPDWSYILISTKRTTTSPVHFLTAAHVWLIRAEAAQLGWTGEDAAALYRSGIKASFEQWGVYQANPFDAYMAGVKVNLASDALKKIRLQNYLALYPDALQGFNIWRRTGVPDLQPTPFAVNPSKQIPRRYTYPEGPQSQNAAAWQEAVDRLGGEDSPDARIWWDK